LRPQVYVTAAAGRPHVPSAAASARAAMGRAHSMEAARVRPRAVGALDDGPAQRHVALPIADARVPIALEVARAPGKAKRGEDGQQSFPDAHRPAPAVEHPDSVPRRACRRRIERARYAPGEQMTGTVDLLEAVHCRADARARVPRLDGGLPRGHARAGARCPAPHRRPRAGRELPLHDPAPRRCASEPDGQVRPGELGAPRSDRPVRAGRERLAYARRAGAGAGRRPLTDRGGAVASS